MGASVAPPEKVSGHKMVKRNVYKDGRRSPGDRGSNGANFTKNKKGDFSPTRQGRPAHPPIRPCPSPTRLVKQP